MPKVAILPVVTGPERGYSFARSGGPQSTRTLHMTQFAGTAGRPGAALENPKGESMRVDFLRPRFWPTWAGLGVLRSLELLPFWMQRQFGSAVGRVLLHLPLAYVRIARRNIDLCLPTLPATEREAVLAEHCKSLGLALGETATTWWSGNARVSRVAEIATSLLELPL